MGGGVVELTLGLVATVRKARREAINPPANAQYDAYREPALWLAANTPPGSLVFNVEWDDFPQLFFWNSHNVYAFGLDPTYTSIYDLERYRLWRENLAGEGANPSGVMRERVGAGYVFTGVGQGGVLGGGGEVA